MPCPCISCGKATQPHFYTVQHLRNFMAKNIIHAQCIQSGEMVEVRPLLDDVVGEKTIDAARLAHLDPKTQALYQAHKRRLYHLKEQQATKGQNTSPEILTEIEDIEQELKQLLHQKQW